VYEDHLKSCEYCQKSERVTRLGTKGASSEVVRKPGLIEREVKLKELGEMIRGR
jgi:hypothetical protein